MAKTDKLKEKLVIINDKISKLEVQRKQILKDIELQDKEEIMTLLKHKNIGVDEIKKLLEDI